MRERSFRLGALSLVWMIANIGALLIVALGSGNLELPLAYRLVLLSFLPAGLDSSPAVRLRTIPGANRRGNRALRVDWGRSAVGAVRLLAPCSYRAKARLRTRAMGLCTILSVFVNGLDTVAGIVLALCVMAEALMLIDTWTAAKLRTLGPNRRPIAVPIPGSPPIALRVPASVITGFCERLLDVGALALAAAVLVPPSSATLRAWAGAIGFSLWLAGSWTMLLGSASQLNMSLSCDRRRLLDRAVLSDDGPISISLLMAAIVGAIEMDATLLHGLPPDAKRYLLDGMMLMCTLIHYAVTPRQSTICATADERRDGVVAYCHPRLRIWVIVWCMPRRYCPSESARS